jgi:hypothetical protein
MNDQRIETRPGLFTRNGHLTMLTLDRFDTGELDVDSCESVIEHLRLCSTCSTRLDDVQAPGPAIQPPKSNVVGRIEPERHPRLAVAIASTLAAAALLLLVGWPRPEQASRITGDAGLTASSYTSTTASFDEAQTVNVQLRVFAGSQQLHHRDFVPSDEAVSVEVETAAAGFVTLFALVPPADDDGGTGGIVEVAHDVVLPVASTASETTSVELRSAPLGYGATVSQTLVAVYCPEPFEVDPGPNGWEVVGAIGDNCESVEFELNRSAEAADS